MTYGDEEDEDELSSSHLHGEEDFSEKKHEL